MHSLVAAVVEVELHIPAVQSLKAKRSVLRPVVEGLRRLASVSVAEVGHHDSWQRAAVGVAVVAPDPGHLEHLLTELRRYLEGCAGIEVVDWGISYLDRPHA